MVFRSTLFFSLILLSLSVFVIAADGSNCLYTLKVKTGDRDSAGTDSKISVRLSTESGDEFSIEDVVAWGGVPGYDYFERGNLDILSGRGPCLGSLFCLLNLTSDGTGNKPGWYVDYVEVISADYPTQAFEIDRWLALDEPPYSLTAVKNNCPNLDVSNHVHNQNLLARPV